MIQRAVIAGAMVLGVAGLGGCATEKYVDEHVATVDTRVSDVSTRVTDHDQKIATLDQTSRDALQRATAAGKLAEGKFLYSEVLTDDSMKFGVSKAALSPEAQARLDAFVDKLKTDNRNVYVEVQGHTDATGEDQLNDQLSVQRAERVRKALADSGVDPNRLVARGVGKTVPIAPNDTEVGRARNRRVEFHVLE